jgi:hypothetical protein
MTCPLCGGAPLCPCTAQELSAWADRQATLPGIPTTAHETVAAFLRARWVARGERGRYHESRQRQLF